MRTLHSRRSTARDFKVAVGVFLPELKSEKCRLTLSTILGEYHTCPVLPMTTTCAMIKPPISVIFRSGFGDLC